MPGTCDRKTDGTVLIIVTGTGQELICQDNDNNDEKLKFKMKTKILMATNEFYVSSQQYRRSKGVTEFTI
jgi:hypothetical protein